MSEFLTEETPAKVMSLVGTAMATMLFLFAVTVSNASFTKVENPLPDTFAPQNVVAVLDIASNAYSNFLQENLFQPVSQDVAFVSDSVNFIADSAGPQIVQLAGLQNLGLQNVAYSGHPTVAGASIERSQSQ